MYSKEKKNITYQIVHVSRFYRTKLQRFVACRNKILIIGSVTKFPCDLNSERAFIESTYRIEIINQKVVS